MIEVQNYFGFVIGIMFGSYYAAISSDGAKSTYLTSDRTLTDDINQIYMTQNLEVLKELVVDFSLHNPDFFV